LKLVTEGGRYGGSAVVGWSFPRVVWATGEFAISGELRTKRVRTVSVRGLHRSGEVDEEGVRTWKKSR
jgi:hypothetical protein